jgi:phage terminase large subunit GpA-like protein
VPAEATVLTAGLDLGKYLCHWIVTAWSNGAAGHIVDYGRIEVASESLGIEQALLIALREFKDLVLQGWPCGKIDGEAAVPQLAFIDAGFMAEVVYTFCREVGERFRPAIGRGVSQQRQQWHNRVTQTGSVVKMIGEAYQANWLPAEQLHLIEIDADYWKSWVHQRLGTSMDQAGAMTLFRAAAQEHLSLAKHLTAETQTEEFVAGKGVVVRWERLRKQNHWFDALYNSCVGGHACGVRLVGEEGPPPMASSSGAADVPRISAEDWLQRPKW